ncbi:TPA: ankyrin repeat domain-containing protein [Klebsiella pneumoniae]
MISRENNKNNLFRVKSKNGVLRCLKAGMDINMCNSKGQTALFTCNVPEAIQAMIDADIDIHHLDNDGNNALFYAQNVETVELLVSNGINVNHRNKSGTLAIQHIDVSPGLVKYLIKAGLDIHTKDSYGNSFLFIPFEGYVYDALIEAGCDINHKNLSGQTAFDYWQSENHSIAGKYTHWESKNDSYIRFLIRNIHLKDSSKIVFTNITFKSIELLSLLIKQKNEFEISIKCIITPTNADVKKLILQLKKLTDISHVWFYINSTYLLTHYAGRLLIKWLICHDIKVDIESLKERYFYEEILQEKSQREQKVLRTTIQPVTCKAITKKRL